MPELGISKTPFLSDLHTDYQRYGLLPPGRIMMFAAKNGVNVINFGDESVVVTHPRIPDRVIAIGHAHSEDAISMKRQFFYNNILATLFPHNIPWMHMATGQENRTDVFGTVREKITEDTNTSGNLTHPFSHVRDICKQWNIPLNFDLKASNYIIMNGGEYFVDPTYITVQDVDRYIDNITAYMEASNYSDQEKKQAQRFIERLKSLNREKSSNSSSR